MIAKGEDQTSAIIDIVREDIKTCKPIRFDGNGYSDEWKEEAQKRGLDCEASCPVVFDRYLDKESIEMFAKTNVMSESELKARNEVKWETYTKKIQIEARVMGDLSMNHIIPVATHYQSRLAKNVEGMIHIFGGEEGKKLTARNVKIIREIAERTEAIERGVEALVDARKVANKIESEHALIISGPHLDLCLPSPVSPKSVLLFRAFLLRPEDEPPVQTNWLLYILLAPVLLLS